MPLRLSQEISDHFSMYIFSHALHMVLYSDIIMIIKIYLSKGYCASCEYNQIFCAAILNTALIPNMIHLQSAISSSPVWPLHFNSVKFNSILFYSICIMLFYNGHCHEAALHEYINSRYKCNIYKCKLKNVRRLHCSEIKFVL